MTDKIETTIEEAINENLGVYLCYKCKGGILEEFTHRDLKMLRCRKCGWEIELRDFLRMTDDILKKGSKDV